MHNRVRAILLVLIESAAIGQAVTVQGLSERLQQARKGLGDHYEYDGSCKAAVGIKGCGMDGKGDQ